MKKLILLFIGILSMSTMYAQDITDAVRYSSDNVEGTARFKAMSGAFGALGGDISAMSVNPAGSAIFSYSHTSLSISSYNSDNETNYFNSVNTNSNSDFAFNQAGAAFVFNSRNNSPWKKFVLGFAYDQTQNFDDDFFASGTSITSIDSYFLANAQGLRLDEIIALPGESIDDAYSDLGASFGYTNQQAFLGYEAYILEPDTDDDANTLYFSNIAPGTFNQQYSYTATGYNGKFGINLAAQYEDNLYLGLNLNSHFINYDRSTFLFEENSNAGSLVTEVDFENNLSTIGNGFSFQLGGIAKLSNDVRVGLTYDSPTWYTISEETSQYVASVRDDGGPTTAIVDPQVINIYPDYKLQTPAKITGSIALVFNQQGLISFDYSRKDYGSTKFKPESDSYFASQNTDISNNLKVANTYRIGGELRQDNFSFRGGYRLEQSPYNDTSFYGDLKGYSLGIGYNFGGTRLDLAYENSKRDINYQLYNVGLTNAARISRENSNFTLSLSMNL
ncbi:outer membrane protein transport protein [Flavobacteriaceae bacterium S0862]|nr:outer membrane protein transport protein [Flavobacteriaceae bacterium S0862]